MSPIFRRANAMVERVVRYLIDDLDGSEAMQTVQFGYAGRSYEIDLSEEHAAEIDEFLAPFVEHGRRVDGGPERRRRGDVKKPPRSQLDMRAVREWARGQGLQVSDRGRVPADIVAKYEAAQVG